MNRIPSLRHVVLLLGLAAAGAWGQRQAIHFDGGVESTNGLSLVFSRPAPACLPTGELVGPDIPRFLPEVLFCAPAGSEQLEVGSSINVLAAGDMGNGEPLFVVNSATRQRLSIHRGEESVYRAFKNNDWSRSYSLLYKDFTKNRPNLLKGQNGQNGGTPDHPGMAFALTSGGAVHDGLVVVPCEVWEPGGEGWLSKRVALAYTTEPRLWWSNPWIIAALAPATDERDTTRGAPWSMSTFPIGGDELIVTWTDYRSPAKTGGQAFATRFVRQGGVWSHETILVHASHRQPFETEHWHCAGYLRHPDGRDTILISVGDAAGDNRLIARTRAAGGAWASQTPVPDSGMDERSTVYEASADWGQPVTVWGDQGFSPFMRHNQVISMIPANPGFSELLCGADETNGVVLGLTYDPDTSLPTWRTLYLPSVTSYAGDGALNFSMSGPPGGPYLGRIDAAATSEWQSNQLETRLLFSPDGERWGQCMVIGTTGERQAICWGGEAYVGSLASECAGFRRLTMPEYRVVRPLAISPSGDNDMRELVPLPSDNLDAGVIVSRLGGAEDLPEGVPPPPCDPGNIFYIDNRSSGGRLGDWRLASDTADVRSPLRSALVRAWVYAVPPQPGTSHPKTTPEINARLFDASNPEKEAWSGRAEFDAGAWMPITLWSRWNPLEDISAGAGTWMPVVHLRAREQGTYNTRFRMLIAWEGLYQDVPTVQGYGLPPHHAGGEEFGAIDGFQLGDEWTMLLTGMVPEDQWDNRVGGRLQGGVRTASPHLPQLFEIDDLAGGTVRVLADPPSEGFRLASEVDGRSRTVNDARSTYWLRGSPVVCIVRSGHGETTLDISVGGGEPRRLSVPETISPRRVRLGPDAMWWYGVEAVPNWMRDNQLPPVFSTMGLWCPTDYNRDGNVDTRDVVAFLTGWSQGDPEADYNGDGNFNSTDILLYLGDFVNGC